MSSSTVCSSRRFSLQRLKKAKSGNAMKVSPSARDFDWTNYTGIIDGEEDEVNLHHNPTVQRK